MENIDQDDGLVGIEGQDGFHALTDGQYAKLMALPDCHNLPVSVSGTTGLLGKSAVPQLVSVNFTALDGDEPISFLNFNYFPGIRGFKVSDSRSTADDVRGFLDNVEISSNRG